MLRLAVLLHRYLGIALGVVVTLWCVSGIVMIYVPYPSLSETARVSALAPLDLDDCCAAPDTLAAALEESSGPSLDGFTIEMFAGRPQLRLSSPWGRAAIDLRSGTPRLEPSPDELEHAAADFARGIGVAGTPSYLGAIVRDQWTVSGDYARDRPLHLFAGNDAMGTQWYVSGQTGDVVLRTDARQRFWSWPGAVTHWLYFTALREHGPLWAQVVIWLAVAALVLTVLGLYLGIRRYGRGPGRRLTPFRGMLRWHHLAGLAFGILTLTWALSGLLSMNPWGLLEGRSFAAERARLRGAPLEPAAVLAVLESLRSGRLPDATTRIESSIVGGELSVIARHVGERTRLAPATLTRLALEPGQLPELAARLRPGVEIDAQGPLDGGDAYYFERSGAPLAPAYRIVYADGERYYLDRSTGELIYAADKPQQRYRWWFSALHRGDFAALARARPFWDVWFLLLLLGVTASTATGTWLGIRRLVRRQPRRGSSDAA